MSTGTGPPAVYLCPTGHSPQLLQLAVGLLPELAERYGSVGVFRPIVDGPSHDRVLEATLAGIDQQGGVHHWGVTADDVLHNPTSAMSQVIDRYSDCQDTYDSMLVLGSEYDCSLAPVEFAWNTRISANIDVPMALVVPSEGGADDVIQRVEVAIDEATGNLAQVLAVLVPLRAGQRLDGRELAGLPVPAFVINEVIGTTSDLGGALDALSATVVAGSHDLSGARTDRLVVADMGLVNLLPLVRSDVTVLFSADRASIALGLLVGAVGAQFPQPAAAIAAGPWELDPDVVKLWDRLGDVPLVRTRRTLAQVHQALAGHQPMPASPNAAQRAEVRRVFAEQVDAAVLFDTSQVIGRPDIVTPLMFEHRLLEAARQMNRHIVLAEGTEPRILRAADRLLGQKICRLTLLGDPARIVEQAAAESVDIAAADIIDPGTSELRERFVARYADLRAAKGVTGEQARERIGDVSYFGTMMVHEGLADGMVSGSVHTTAHTVRPALEIIKTKPGVSVVSSVSLMCLPDKVVVFGDCAVIPNPTPEQVAAIAISAAATARQFGIEPRVALLSYSTGTSGAGPDIEQTIAATSLVHERAPELIADGPLQYDAAIDPTVARTKRPDSPVAGQATVMIFPDLQTGNSTYKAVQRSVGAVAIGPILQGLRKPVNDLSRGALVSDIVNTVAITAIQAGTG
ncbi:MAG: phosphate acetyltransferase [Arachnia sp.]